MGEKVYCENSMYCCEAVDKEQNRCLAATYREYFYCIDRVNGSAHHGDRCAACREAHANFADESACLTADNVRNEVVTIHRSQEVLKMLSSLHVNTRVVLKVMSNNFL
jgi:hypothetical protein